MYGAIYILRDGYYRGETHVHTLSSLVSTLYFILFRNPSGLLLPHFQVLKRQQNYYSL